MCAQNKRKSCQGEWMWCGVRRWLPVMPHGRYHGNSDYKDPKADTLHAGANQLELIVAHLESYSHSNGVTKSGWSSNVTEDLSQLSTQIFY